MEAGFEVSALPSTRQSNSNLSNTVNGALFSRNSYIGLANPAIGAIKIGKTDAPYKNSTAAFNPFSGKWGDYAVIMGNTGGDNRVEFGTRLAHAIWYESPKMGGFQLNLCTRPARTAPGSATISRRAKLIARAATIRPAAERTAEVYRRLVERRR